MSTVLATAVAIGFAWSAVLFFAAVFVRDRQQEDAFGWALGGAALFLIVYADRLPGHPIQLREVIGVLPGVADGRQLFVSSMAALTVLFCLYVYRIAVFYYLMLRGPADTAEERNEDLANDKVAPTLSYFCFAICVVALLQPVYALGTLVTCLLCVGLVFAYYGGVLPRLLQAIRNLGTIARIALVRARRVVTKLVLRSVLLIASLERFRHGNVTGRVTETIRRLEEEMDRDEVKVREDERSIIARAAGNGTGSKTQERTPL